MKKLPMVAMQVTASTDSCGWARTTDATLVQNL
jgi:hypothetical protein